MTEDMEQKELQKLPPSVFVVGALTQVALGMHVPFLQAYLLEMNPSFLELGIFRSVRNFAPTILQPVWGATSDKVGHTKAFVAFGTFTGLVTVALFLGASTPIEMIVLYAIQSVLFSIQIPTWLSLIGGLMSEENRGDELGRLGVITNTASLIATLLSGFLAGLPIIIPFLRTALGQFGVLLFPPMEVWREAYVLPFYLTAIIGIVTSFLSLAIKEKSRESEKKREFPPVLRLLSQPGDFRRFCFVTVPFSFAMSMAWPYFMVVQVNWLNNTLLEIGIASAIMTLFTIVFTLPFGRMSDRVGRKPLIVLGRGMLWIVPVMYAFASHVYIIFIANALAGLTVAASWNAVTAYIYDVSPEEERGSHLAVYNTFTGIVFGLGSLFGGFLGDWLSLFMSEYLAVFYMLLLIAVLRFVSSFFYLLIKEPREYSSTLRAELSGFFNGRRFESDGDGALV
ncbi:MAG: MFS transporter [Candidatus Thorarchaeota archaeon]|jgi:MFS family permease